MIKLIVYGGLAYFLWGRKQAIAEVGEVQMLNPSDYPPVSFNPELPPLVQVQSPTYSGCGVFTPAWACKP